jgi:hypothetical protein
MDKHGLAFVWDIEPEERNGSSDGNFWYVVCLLLVLFFGYKSRTTTPYTEEEREILEARSRDNRKVIAPAQKEKR